MFSTPTMDFLVFFFVAISRHFVVFFSKDGYIYMGFEAFLFGSCFVCFC